MGEEREIPWFPKSIKLISCPSDKWPFKKLLELLYLNFLINQNISLTCHYATWWWNWNSPFYGTTKRYYSEIVKIICFYFNELIFHFNFLRRVSFHSSITIKPHILNLDHQWSVITCSESSFLILIFFSIIKKILPNFRHSKDCRRPWGNHSEKIWTY